MHVHRETLPQASSPQLYLADGGLETDLIFHEGYDLPLFASFPLLDDPRGCIALRHYYRAFADVAKAADAGFVLEAATWRASRDWAFQLGYTTETLAAVNRRGVSLLVDLREELGAEDGSIVISAAVGPRGDAYHPGELMTPLEAQDYHREQIETLASTDADFVTALTITHAAEAIGIVRAAQATEVPVVISFTVETDGSLPDGSWLAAAIREVDDATDSGPAYYGINCAHPSHFIGALSAEDEWTRRIRMIRANSSRMSHTELDNAIELDEGDPQEFGREQAHIRGRFPHINVLGGCCGTDVRHVQAIAWACREPHSGR